MTKFLQQLMVGSKPIKGFENYHITKWGLVVSFGQNSPTGKLRKPQLNTTGYSHYVLRKNGKSYMKMVHRLVAEHLIPNPENKPCVNHINGIKTDNRSENLEWCTQKENVTHAMLLGLRAVGERTNNNKLTELEVVQIKELFRAGGVTKAYLAKKFSVNVVTIREIVKGRAWSHVA